MPQQPLSNVRINAKIYDSPEALERRPELAGLLALAIANWAEIEVRLIALLTAVLGASAAVAIAMVQILRSSSIQIEMITTAGKAALKDPELEMFEAIMNMRPALAKNAIYSPMTYGDFAMNFQMFFSESRWRQPCK